MIKALIFDFDGVLVESSDIKTAAFRQLFAGYPEKVNEIVKFHKKNMGISRYVKFRHIYEHMLQKPLSVNDENALGERFSQLVLAEVIKAPFVKGALEFLKENKNKYLFFIASGTPEAELVSIIDQKGIGDLFKGFYGSPLQKSGIIKKILSGHGLKTNEVIFVGDADSDKAAAEETRVPFVARLDNNSGQNFAGCRWQIADFSTLQEIIDNIEKGDTQ
jgi:phosphoglycolate phosphatase-like HAD superfamily hydrolase